MSSITLSAATRQNLLSLQDTAALTATTQNRLATGKKVNSALDDPLSFFTAQGLDNRSNDLNNLLNGVSNGVQVIQAANQGITSIQKLIDSAKSLANQALASKNPSTPAVSASTTSTTAGSAFAAPGTAGTIDFTIDGVSQSITTATTDTAASTVAALNAKFTGSSPFSVDASGKITVSSTTNNIALDTGNAAKLGFGAAIAGTAAVAAGPDATRTSLSAQFNSLLRASNKTGFGALSGDGKTAPPRRPLGRDRIVASA